MVIMDQECPRCDGEGWIARRRAAHGLHGVFEETCPRCRGTGVVQIDCETGDEIEEDPTHDRR